MNELEKHVEGNLLQFIGKYKGQIEGVLSRQIDPKRFAKLIIGQINRTPKLLGCTPMSVVNCLVQAASLGLELRPNQAYLVPFKDKCGRLQCTLLIDYRGKIDLAKRSGYVEDIEARLVYSTDQFECVWGLEPKFKHVPSLSRQVSGHLERVAIDDRGAVVLGYAIAWLKAGRVHVETMTFDEIERIRGKSKAKKEDSPWSTDWDQMARKTLVHRICNYIPQSPEVAASQEIDDRGDLELPLDSVLDVAPEDEEKPILEQSHEAQNEVLARRLSEQGVPEEKAAEIVTARAEKAKARHRPKNGIPVFDEFPPIEETADGQQLWVKNKLYRFEEQRSAFAPVEMSAASR